ncbi:hypothetical protein LTR53_002701, partial [Teratosphaeriaceae sp. CCFEE 6253]
MPDQRNVVVLGASYAGLRAAHYILRYVIPQLPSDGNATYRLLLVDPSTKWYARHAAPRAATGKDTIPYDRIFLDIEPGFAQYGNQFSFIHGKATAWDSDERSITVAKVDGGSIVLPYHALVLATGSKTDSPLFTAQADGYEKIQAALDAFHKQLASAKRIIITGGGATAVETAGELGEHLNGAAGWFASRPTSPKAEITVITNSARLLPNLRPAIGATAETYLHRVGVDVRYGTKVSTSRQLPNGKTAVVLHDGEELETDIYVPAVGVQPLSEYIPAPLKDAKGYVAQNGRTLRVDAAGARVYAVGDLGSASRNGILDIMDEIPVLGTNLRRDLLAAHTDIHAKPEGKDRCFEPNMKETQLVPVGRSKGVGAVFGWRIPSLVCWLIKGRDYMLGGAPDTINGGKWTKEVPWTAT